jgi:hypothetical protein
MLSRGCPPLSEASEFAQTRGMPAYLHGCPPQELVNEHGMFDLVLDTVSSVDARDRASAYVSRLRTTSPPLIKTLQSSPTDEAMVDAHNYVVFGGPTWQWACAGIQRFTHMNLHPKGFCLFWINMQNSQPYLQRLQAFADEQGLRPTVGVVSFEEAALQNAFRRQHPPLAEPRKVVGKQVVDLTRGEAEGFTYTEESRS